MSALPDFTAVWIATGVAIAIVLAVAWLNDWIDGAPEKEDRRP